MPLLLLVLDTLGEGILAGLIVVALVSLGGGLIRHRMFLWRHLLCTTILRRKRLRISISALLRVEGGGQYVLIRSVRNPAEFGPIGGVFKHFDTAQKQLNRLEFEPQRKADGTPMGRDLRGYIPPPMLSRLRRWFLKGVEREAGVECLSREIREELGRIELSAVTRGLNKVEFQRVWMVETGPEPVEGRDYYQYRLHEVFEPIPGNAQASALSRRLFEAAGSNQNLTLVTAEEIRQFKTRSGDPIGKQAIFLVQRKGPRFEFATFR